MNAKEMFESLGYERHEGENGIQYFSEFGVEITFIFLTRRFYKQENYKSLNISVDEFKAIQQQMKELGWIAKEEKQETNFEHYFEFLSKRKMMDYALVDGGVVQCLGTPCEECDFNGDCIEKKFKWLKQPYEKPKYELSQFEFDLINTFDSCKECCLLNEIECLKKLREKGYFNGIDYFTKVHEILDNCEVIQ